MALYFFGILFFFVIGTNISSAQDAPVYFKLDGPSLVKTNSLFSVSLVSRVFDEDADKLEVNIFVDDGIGVEGAELNQNNQKLLLSVKKRIDVQQMNVYTLDLNIDNNFDKSLPYQIIYTLKSNRQENTKIGFSVLTYTGTEMLHKYSSRDELNYKYDLSMLDIDIFDESRVEERDALKFTNNSRLYSEPVKDIKNNLVVDFWINFDGSEKNFFSIVDDLSNEEIISFSRNSFGILSVDFEGNIESQKERFLSNEVWNHITVEYKYFENSFDLYVNDSLAYSIMPYSFIDLEKIAYLFENENGDFPFELYGFRIWDYGDEIVELQKNRFKGRINLENSELKREISASIIKNSFTNLDDPDTKYSNVKIEKEALIPIFSQVPECNVAIQSSFYSIRWKLNDVENAEYFEIEKSENGNQYYKIGEVLSNYDKDEYEFLEAKQDNEQVVYFRVKQVNKDETKVYSSSVKVGVSEIEEFVLEQNYPNPFNPTTRISVEIIIPNDFDINIYDVTGEKVGKLHKGFLSQGVHEFTFSAAGLPSGIYFCEVKSGVSSEVKKMILAK